jgi:hypothetical protein
MRSPLTLLSTLIVLLVLLNQSRAQQVEPGAVVTPKSALTLRAAPPGGFIGLKGDTIGTVTPNETYKVLEKKSISTVLGGENWLKLQSVNDASKQGWVFTGTREAPTANVTINSR